MFDDANDALAYLGKQDIAAVDLKVTGLAGQWLHVTVPAKSFGKGHFEFGVGFDGSSGSGFGRVESGDVAALPDPTTGFVDPFAALPTVCFVSDTVTADTREPFSHGPRTIGRRAEQYLQQSGIADEARFAPEFEFYVFEKLELLNDSLMTGVQIAAAESRSDGVHYPIPPQQGYMRSQPADQLHDLRGEIVSTLESVGVSVRYHHHEVGAAGQCEIEVHSDTLVRAADKAQIIKYVIKNTCARHGKLATFMPKPIFGQSGSGMHVHQNLTKGGRNQFFDGGDSRYAGLSDTALQYISGLLANGRALTALTNPSTNSFKRLVEGYEAPVCLFFSLGNRSAAIRVPGYATQEDEKRIEYRPPDFTGNVYLSLAAMLMAGIDGVERQLKPADHHFGPFDVDIARQDAAFRSRIAHVPGSLSQAIEALRDDHAFLCKGQVFDRQFIENWCRLKTENDVKQVACRPHPYEYALYLDA